MLRSLLFLAACLLASPALAQSNPPASLTGDACLVRINATPASWLIQGYDPFDTSLPEATFSATFINEGGGECRFTPVFELDQPPFGLSKGGGRPLTYALLDLTNSQDVTPRAGRSQRGLSQREITLGPNEGRTLLYKLVVAGDDVREAGEFSQDIVINAQDSNFRSLGSGRVVLGIQVLPSARIGMAGAFSMKDGQVVVDLGELRPGLASVPLQLRVNSTSRYEIDIVSANAGRLRLGASEWYVPYSIALGGNSVNLAGPTSLSPPGESGFRRDSLPIQFVIGSVANLRAGVYSDVISVSVTAR